MKKIIALALVLVFAFSFAACKKEEEVPVETTTDAFADVTLGDSLGERPTTATNDAATDVDASGNVVTEPATEAPKAPEGKEEIVEFFNTAVNNVKPNAKSVVHHYSKITVNGKTKFPAFIDTAMKLLGGADAFINDQLAKNSKGEQTYTGADIDAKFPVEGESYASKLTAADVKSAQIGWTDDGDYIIEIAVYDDAKSSNVKHGAGHAPKAFNVVLPGIVNDNVPGPVANMLGGEAEMNYPSCKVRAVVDYETGNLISAVYTMNWTINFGTDIVIPFTTTDSYTINW